MALLAIYVLFMSEWCGIKDDGIQQCIVFVFTGDGKARYRSKQRETGKVKDKKDGLALGR